MRLASCRSCNASIIWTVTTNGKQMPVDPDPVHISRGFRIPDQDTSEKPLAVFTAEPEAGELLFQSHFATCPTKDQHRMPR